MKAKYTGQNVGIVGLKHGKVYEITGVEHGMFRVIDDSEEDYLYAIATRTSRDSTELHGVWEIVEDNEQKDLENAMKMLGIEVKRAIDVDGESIRKINDANLEDIRRISSSAFRHAIDIASGTKIPINQKQKQQLENVIVTMELLLDLVDSKYQEEAETLVEEGKKDIGYIVNPQTKVVSNRLKDYIQKREKGGEER